MIAHADEECARTGADRTADLASIANEHERRHRPHVVLLGSHGMFVDVDFLLREMETVRVTREVAERFAKRGGIEPVDPSEDEAIEARWDWGRGQLERWRKARPTAIMWQVRDRGLTHYQPTYAPTHGLMFPFRAADAEAAAMLIGAACEHGISREVESLLVDPPAIAAFREAGARNVETLYEMGGPLPPAP